MLLRIFSRSTNDRRAAGRSAEKIGNAGLTAQLCLLALFGIAGVSCAFLRVRLGCNRRAVPHFQFFIFDLQRLGFGADFFGQRLALEPGNFIQALPALGNSKRQFSVRVGHVIGRFLC